MTYIPPKFGMSNIGNTSGTTGTVNRGIVFAGGNNVTLSQSINGSSATISISAANQTVQTQNLHNLTLGGNTTGVMAQVSSGTLTLVGGNNITLSQAGNALTISGPNQTNQNITMYASGGTTQNSSTVLNANSLLFNGLGGATVGYSNGSIQISGAQTVAQTNQTVGIYALGNTTQSSSGTRDARSLSFNGLGGVSVGYSNGSIQISGITGGGGGGIALANSQTTYTSGTANLFEAGGAITIASSVNGAGQSFNFSVPALSSLSVSGILSLFTNGNTVSIGAPAFSIGISTLGNTLGTTGTVSNQMIFAGGNNITLSQATDSVGNTLTISAAAQTNQTVGLYALGNTTQSSSGTRDARSISFNGLGAASVGYTNGSFQISVPTQTNQTIGFSAGNNTSLTSSGTFDARSMRFNGLGAASIGFSASSMFISVPTQTNQTASLIQAIYDGVNSVTTGTIRLSNLNGLSFGLNGQTLTASHNGITSQTVQTQNMVSILGSSGNISFANSNNITFGGNASTITASASFNQTNQAVGGYAVGNTTGQSSSSTMDARTLSFNGAGNVSVGYSAGSIMISGGTAAPSPVNFSAGTASGNLGSIVFSNANGVSFGLNGSTITASAAGGGGGGGIALGNSQTTYTSGTANIVEGGGAITIVSSTNGASQSFNIFVPQTSSMSATGGVSIFTNGSTISIGAPAAGTISNWEPNQLQYGSLSNTQMGNGSVYFYKLQANAFVNASQFMQLVSISMSSSSNSSHAGALSIAAGIFTASGSTLSLVTQSSGSASYQWTNTSNGSYSVVSGLRGLTMPLNISMSEGNYWLGMWSQSTTTGANWFTASNMLFTNISSSYQGILGQAINATQGIQEGVGFYSASSSALPTNIAMSRITQNNMRSAAMPYIVFKNQTW